MSKPTISPKETSSKKRSGRRVAKPSRKKASRQSTGKKLTSSPSVRPSNGWTSFEGENEFQEDKVRDIFKTADWPFLCCDAMKCRQSQSTIQGQRKTHGLTCKVNRDRFAFGQNNLVLEVEFSDLTYWVVRIKFLTNAEDDPEVEKSMHSEVATMRLIKERTSIPIPTVFGYNAEQDNPFGYQYIFMSVLPGRHLDACFAKSVPQQHQAKVADQLAEILHALSTKMTFDRIGRVWCGQHGEEEPSIISFIACGAYEGEFIRCPVGPFQTSLEYFYILRQNENSAVRAAMLQGILGQVDEEIWLVACQVLEQTLCRLVLAEQMTGPFPLQHVDLHYNNILIDNDFNITGVMDWSGAQTVPRESFVVSPEFIISPGISKEAAAQESSFRNMVQKAWKKRESDQKDPESAWSISDTLGSARGDLINFSYTHGALRRSVAYARIVATLLYGPGFSLETFKKHSGTSS